MATKSKRAWQITRMPFGIHEGKLFTDIPKGYLVWIVSNIKDRPEVVQAAKRALNRTQKKGRPQKPKKKKRGPSWNDRQRKTHSE